MTTHIPFGSHPEDVIENPWEALTNDQADDVKANTLKELAENNESEVFGIKISFYEDPFYKLMYPLDIELGHDWLERAIKLPRSIREQDAIEQLWNAICDYVTEEAERIQINNGRGR